MSQEDLAKRMKVSRQTINAIENEKFNPSLDLALKLARAFGVRIEELFKVEKELE